MFLYGKKLVFFSHFFFFTVYILCFFVQFFCFLFAPVFFPLLLVGLWLWHCSNFLQTYFSFFFLIHLFWVTIWWSKFYDNFSKQLSCSLYFFVFFFLVALSSFSVFLCFRRFFFSWIWYRIFCWIRCNGEMTDCKFSVLTII